MKQSDSALEVERLASKTKEMIPWLDPQLADAANRLVIYQQLKLKAMANEEIIRREQMQQEQDDLEEKVKHERWLRKLEIKQSIQGKSQQNRLEREAEELAKRTEIMLKEQRRQYLLKQQLIKRKKEEIQSKRDQILRQHAHMFYMNQSRLDPYAREQFQYEQYQLQ